MYCEKCGSKIPEGVKFCSCCGRKVAENGSKKGSTKAIVIVGIVIMIGMLVGGGLFYWKKQDNLVKGNENNLEQLKESEVIEVGKQEFIRKSMEVYYGLEFSSRYEYNKSGKIVKELRRDVDGNLWILSEWEYDANGNCLEYKYYEKVDTIFRRTVYEYDGEGKLLGYKEYDREGNIVEYKVCVYNKSENLFLEEIYDKEGKLEHSYKYTYDKDGNSLEREHYSVSLETIYYGKWCEEKEIYIDYYSITDRADEEIDWEHYIEYNEHGDMISEKTVYSNGYVLYGQNYEYIYDKNGNILERKSIDGEGNIENFYYEYKYDEYGNKISEIMYEEDGSVIYSYISTYY